MLIGVRKIVPAGDISVHNKVQTKSDIVTTCPKE
jgi:hypothetical protein